MPTSTTRLDQHQNKRPFQPQITSFFSSSISSSHISSSQKRASLEHYSIEDNIEDAAVQASLLNVGMRIRKAVPEGYKTHKTQLFMDSTPTSSTYSARMTSMAGIPAQRPQQQQQERGRDLLPFCGIHKVGGLAVQNSYLDHFNGGPVDALGISIEDAFLPSSSQESNASVAHPDDASMILAGGVARKKKRRAEFEDDDSGFDGDNEDEVFFGAEHFVPFGEVTGRQIAQPRSRIRAERLQPVLEGFEGGSGDFDDAPFLRPRDGEVEMGGME
jgi:ribonucleotide reductase inhibitor